MNNDIDSTAVHWFGRVRLNEPTAIDSAAFERWRSANPENAAAFIRAEQVWQDLGDLKSLPEARAFFDEERLDHRFFDEVAQQAKPQPSFFRRYRLPLALAASVIAAAMVFIPRLLSGDRYETQTAEVRALNLPDGSRVTLGAQSRIDIRFTDTERRLHLKGGEAFFEVHKDPKRPFIVDAGATRIRVLGTKFDVHRGQEQINVAVLEGKVAVTTNTPRSATGEGPRVKVPQDAQASGEILLTAGQQLSTGTNRPNTTPKPTNRNTPPGAWRTGRLSYDNAPLDEVIADVNRYYPAGVSLATERLADLKVTTAFSVDQIDPLINSLTLALPISVQRGPDGHVTLIPQAN